MACQQGCNFTSLGSGNGELGNDPFAPVWLVSEHAENFGAFTHTLRRKC